VGAAGIPEQVMVLADRVPGCSYIYYTHPCKPKAIKSIHIFSTTYQQPPQPYTSGNKVFAIGHLDRLSHNKYQPSQADCKENGNLQGQVETIRRVQMCPPKGPPE